MAGVPKFVKEIEIKVSKKLLKIKKTDSELLEAQQLHCNEILEVIHDYF